MAVFSTHPVRKGNHRRNRSRTPGRILIPAGAIHSLSRLRRGRNVIVRKTASGCCACPDIFRICGSDTSKAYLSPLRPSTYLIFLTTAQTKEGAKSRLPGTWFPHPFFFISVIIHFDQMSKLPVSVPLIT